MSSPEANTSQPGELVDDMRVGLMGMLGLRQTFNTLRNYQQGFIDQAAGVGQVQDSMEELQQALSGLSGVDRESQLFNFLLEHGDRYYPEPVATVGHIAILLHRESELMERGRQAWAKGPVAQKWLGKTVVVKRPGEAVTRHDAHWGNQGPLYRTLEDDEPATPYYRGGADRHGFQGRPEKLSLEQDGSLIIARDQSATEIIEMFEPVEDPKTGAVINYLPRVTIEALSRSDRLRRNLRAAAIDRLGPDLEG